MTTSLSIKFLGTGNSHAHDLGSASCVIEKEGAPILLIDCGPETVPTYIRIYEHLPRAVFITHAHLDHIGGLENLFYRAYFEQKCSEPVKLYIPVKLVEVIQKRIADYPSILAEGGANFWDCFQLIPVSDSFWHKELHFTVFPVRHHQYLSAYGLSLSGAFLFTGDTCPIPEVLNHYASHNETIFHDCCIQNNPSHTCLYELEQCYSPSQLQRMVFYHYESVDAGNIIKQNGFRVAHPLEKFTLQARSLNMFSSLDTAGLSSAS